MYSYVKRYTYVTTLNMLNEVVLCWFHRQITQNTIIYTNQNKPL